MGWCYHLMRWGRLQKEQFGIQVETLSEKLDNWVRKQIGFEEKRVIGRKCEWGNVLFSQGCYTKVPQTGWLKNHRNLLPYSSGVQNQGVIRALILLKTLRIFLPPPASGRPRDFSACDYITAISASIFILTFCMCVSLCLVFWKGHQSLDTGPSLNPRWFYVRILT